MKYPAHACSPSRPSTAWFHYWLYEMPFAERRPDKIRARSCEHTEAFRSNIYQALRTAGDPRIAAADAQSQHLTASRQPRQTRNEPKQNSSVAQSAPPDLEPNVLDTPPTPTLDPDENMDDDEHDNPLLDWEPAGNVDDDSS